MSVLPLAIGISERTPPTSVWANGWFVLGFVIAAFGALALLWALVLVVAHHHAEIHETRHRRYIPPFPDARWSYVFRDRRMGSCTMKTTAYTCDHGDDGKAHTAAYAIRTEIRNGSTVMSNIGTHDDGR